MTELEAWMTFLASDKPNDINSLIKEYPEFQKMYQEINQFRLHPEEMMAMLPEAIRMLDEGDALMQIERMREEITEKDKEIAVYKQENDQQAKEIEIYKQENDQQARELEDQRKMIADLQRRLVEQGKDTF